MKQILWEQYDEWKQKCTWVELSHELSADTPHWDGFPEMMMPTFFDFDKTPFRTHQYNFVGQYGTHVDPPIHFIQGAATLDSFGPAEMVMPLCVIDLSEKVTDDHDYSLSALDVKQWEERYGTVPEGSFVAFRSDWSKLETMEKMENRDAEGNKHYPGWSVEALRYLIDERNIGAIGHEPCDTDPPVFAEQFGYVAEHCILESGRYQIELLCNLDQCPPTGSLIFCTFPKVRNGSGFPARCFALCPK